MIPYRKFGEEVALQAGKIMRKNFSLHVKKEWKADNTPLTVADTQINTLVIDAVKKSFPSHGVLGEEENFKTNSEYLWVCDPLDGTIPFSHGIPTAVFSLALTHKGIPIFGIVSDPFMERMVVAEKGKGTYLNNKRISVSENKEFQNSVMTVEGLKSPILDTNSFKLALAARGVKVLTLCGFVYAGMLVAIGELIGTVYSHRFPWDVAALKIIVDEAGGKCTDLQGKEQLYNQRVNGFIASNGLVHDRLVQLLGNYYSSNK